MTANETYAQEVFNAISENNAYGFLHSEGYRSLYWPAKEENYSLTCEIKETLQKAAAIEKQDDDVVPHVANKIEKGAVLFSCWGWEQTNVEFYVVVRCTAKTAWVVPMSCNTDYTEYMSGVKTPDAILWHGEVERRKITAYNDEYLSGGRDKQNLYLWNGKPKAFSSYA